MCHKSNRVQNKRGSPPQLNFQFATKAIVTFCKVQKQKQKRFEFPAKPSSPFARKSCPRVKPCKAVERRKRDQCK